MRLNKKYPLGKYIHVFIGRSGAYAWAIVDGVKYSITHDWVLEISNNRTISNASRFSQLRKFNFADEIVAQSLWNGGRWWERSIDEVYRGVSPLQMLQNEYLPSSLTLPSWHDTAGSSDLFPANPDKMIFLTEPLFQSIVVGEDAPIVAPNFNGQIYMSDTNRVFIAK